MKRLALALAILFTSTLAHAQCNGVFPAQTVCGNSGGSANTARAVSAISFLGSAGGSNGQIQYNNASILGGFTMGGDCTFAVPNVTCTKTSGTAFGFFATSTAATGLTGNLAIARFNSGTNATGTSYWRGDGTWATAVSSVTCGTGLTGGAITTTGTCAVSLSTLTNSIGANVLLNNTGTFFTGPTVAQGSTGTWCAFGTVTVADSSATSSNIHSRLTDGTTVMASTAITTQSGNGSARVSVSLSGCIASPAGNIRIEVNDSTATTGTMYSNQSTQGKDSTITVFRVN